MTERLTVKRYECVYTNSFKDKYSADRELDPDGSYVLYTDHQAVVAELEGKLQQATEREAKLRGFVENIVNALGPYPELNGTQVVYDAYQALTHNPKG